MTATNKAQFAFRRHDVGGFTTVDEGLGSWQDGTAQRVVPTASLSGRTAGVRRLLLTDGGVSFTIEATPEAYAQMWLASGREFFIRIRPRGRGPGLPETVYSGPMIINLRMPESAVLSFSCELRANSVDRGAQS